MHIDDEISAGVILQVRCISVYIDIRVSLYIANDMIRNASVFAFSEIPSHIFNTLFSAFCNAFIQFHGIGVI